MHNSEVLNVVPVIWVSRLLVCPGVRFVHAPLRLPSDPEDPGALPAGPDAPHLRGAPPAHRAASTGSGAASSPAAGPVGLRVCSAQLSFPEGVNVLKRPVKLWAGFHLYQPGSSFMNMGD